MYNSAKIKRLESELKSKIREIMLDYNEEFEKAIKAQIPKGHKIYDRMGVFQVENSNGEDIENDFIDYVSNLLWGEGFHFAIYPKVDLFEK